MTQYTTLIGGPRDGEEFAVEGLRRSCGGTLPLEIRFHSRCTHYAEYLKTRMGEDIVYVFTTYREAEEDD